MTVTAVGGTNDIFSQTNQLSRKLGGFQGASSWIQEVVGSWVVA